MVMIYTTNVTVSIASVTVNAKAFTWEEMQGEDGEGATPAMVINQTTPIGYNPPHKYCRLTVQAVSDAFAALFSAGNGGPYIVPGGDNKLITSFVVSAKASDGSTITFTCANVMPGKSTMTIDASGKEVVTIYSFKCDSVTPSA
jgi:hypothetical protein